MDIATLCTYIYMVQLNSNLTLIFDHSHVFTESRTNDCVFFASNSCGVTNLTRDWWKPSLHTSLLTSLTEELQEQDSIARTRGFPIKVSLYIDININK